MSMLLSSYVSSLPGHHPHPGSKQHVLMTLGLWPSFCCLQDAPVHPFHAAAGGLGSLLGYCPCPCLRPTGIAPYSLWPITQGKVVGACITSLSAPLAFQDLPDCTIVLCSGGLCLLTGSPIPTSSSCCKLLVPQSGIQCAHRHNGSNTT